MVPDSDCVGAGAEVCAGNVWDIPSPFVLGSVFWDEGWAYDAYAGEDVVRSFDSDVMDASAHQFRAYEDGGIVSSVCWGGPGECEGVGCDV